jgi:hypothetical protein
MANRKVVTNSYYRTADIGGQQYQKVNGTRGDEDDKDRTTGGQSDRRTGVIGKGDGVTGGQGNGGHGVRNRQGDTRAKCHEHGVS